MTWVVIKTSSAFLSCRMSAPAASSQLVFFMISLQAGTWGSGQSAAGGADPALSIARSSAARSLTSTMPTRRRILP